MVVKRQHEVVADVVLRLSHFLRVIGRRAKGDPADIDSHRWDDAVVGELEVGIPTLDLVEPFAAKGLVEGQEDFLAVFRAPTGR